MIKLFATDLDGTLLNKDHKIDDYIISGIKKIVDSGCGFCAATGRAPNAPTLPGVDDICHHIYFNGALGKDVNGEVVKDVLLNKEAIALLIEAFPHVFFEFCTTNGIYCPKTADGYVETIEGFLKGKGADMEWRMDYTNRRMKVMKFGLSVSEIQALDIYKCNIMCDPIDKEQEYTRGLAGFIDEHSDIMINTPFIENNFEITSPDGNKGSALRALCEHLGIKEDEVCVYGDGINDLPMLAAFPNSFAPNTAMEIAKEAANTIIGPYDEYSVINHMLSVIENESNLPV